MKCNRLVDVGRRQFLRGGVLGVGGAAVATVFPAAQARASPSLAMVDYPSTKLGNIADLKVNEPVDIGYPDADSPGILLKVGTPVEGGAGPDGDMVAYSVLCLQKGFVMSYAASGKILNFPLHFSRFDCEKGGQQIRGHSTQNLPQFALRVDDNGDIYAEGADELIYGRLSNVLQA